MRGVSIYEVKTLEAVQSPRLSPYLRICAALGGAKLRPKLEERYCALCAFSRGDKHANWCLVVQLEGV
jgi:hypothetical protein